MRIVQITDVHLLPNAGDQLYGVDTGFALEVAVDQIARLDPLPELIIATGDLAEDGGEKTYHRFQSILNRLTIPTLVLPGNHDDIGVMRRAFNVNSFHCVENIEFGGWGFVLLNSQVVGESHGMIDDEDMISMKQFVESMADKPVLIALHHTPTPVCPSFGCQLQNADELLKWVASSPNIKGIIAGHTHNAVETQQHGVTVMTTPSTFVHVTHAQHGESSDHDDFWASHQLDDQKKAFRTLDLYPDGQIDSAVHWFSS